nr:nucleotide-binding alpha-beta plait domain-containing protein [Tanacetum cinerariifolium]
LTNGDPCCNRCSCNGSKGKSDNGGDERRCVVVMGVRARVTMVETKGDIRAKETPGWVPDFLEDAEDEDQSDVDSKDGRSKVHESGSCEESDGEGVPKTLFDEDGLMKNQSEEENMDKHDDMSKDPFRIYSLLKKKDKVESRGGNSENGNEGNVDVDNVVPSGNHSGGFILSLLDDVVKVGQVMGYKIDNVSVGSWFSQINQASMDFVSEGRIAWVELEGGDVYSLEKTMHTHEKP